MPISTILLETGAIKLKGAVRILQLFHKLRQKSSHDLARG